MYAHIDDKCIHRYLLTSPSRSSRQVFADDEADKAVSSGKLSRVTEPASPKSLQIQQTKTNLDQLEAFDRLNITNYQGAECEDGAGGFDDYQNFHRYKQLMEARLNDLRKKSKAFEYQVYLPRSKYGILSTDLEETFWEE